eukprot:1090688-Alexandrium_andersonii.AAC.1
MPPLPEILLVSIYLVVGAGIDGQNAFILGKVARCVEGQRQRAIVGGDFNMGPAQARRLGPFG